MHHAQVTAFLSAMIFVCTVSVQEPGAASWSCVPYARSASNIHLQGDAWKWWNAAAGIYQRGKKPDTGAVLVFKKTSTMPYGHVAVVRAIEGKRRVLVDHANWSHSGQIETHVPVLDISPANDWSQIRVWHTPSRTLGSTVYLTSGFIYPGPPEIMPLGPVLSKVER